LMHIPASLGFRSMHYINERLKKDSDFLGKFLTDSEKIEADINEYLLKKLTSGAKDLGKTELNLQSLAENPKLRTEALLDTIHKYFLSHDRDVLANRNHVFEAAIDSGLIPTF